MAENAISFHVTPADFDVTTAPQEVLQSYGIPPRPDESDPEALRAWRTVFTKDFRLIRPEFGKPSGRRHGPVVWVSEADGTSANWSGAVITPPIFKTFNKVSAQWYVVTVEPSAAYAPYYVMSSWVGIDGWGGSGDVLQAGIDQQASESGDAAVYWVWYEWYPADPVAITNLTVQPGDLVVCSVTALSSNTAQVFMSVNNVGVSFSFTAPSGTNLVGNCAEWIVERPQPLNEPGQYLTLPQYAVVGFSSIAAYVSGDAATVYDLCPNQTSLSMVDGNVRLSVPEVVGCTGLQLRFTGPTWGDNDLTAVTSAPAAAAGSALTSWADAHYEHVIFISADQHVHELYYPLAGGNWGNNDLTAVTSAPAAAAGSALTSWAGTAYQHVIFLSGEGVATAGQHVYELYYPLAGGNWGIKDLTAVIGTPAAVAGSALTSWANPGFQHVIFVSANQHVHELYGALS